MGSPGAGGAWTASAASLGQSSTPGGRDKAPTPPKAPRKLTDAAPPSGSLRATPQGSQRGLQHGEKQRGEEEEHAHLVEEIMEADKRLMQLLPEARRLREQKQQGFAAFQERTEAVRAKLLSGKIHAVDMEEHHVRRKHQELRKQPVHPMALEQERYLAAPEAEAEQPMPAELPPDVHRLPPKRSDEEPQPPFLQFDEREVLQSNALLLPPMTVPEGPLQRIGFVGNVYRMARLPRQWDPELASRIPVLNTEEKIREMWETPAEYPMGRDFAATCYPAPTYQPPYQAGEGKLDCVFRGQQWPWDHHHHRGAPLGPLHRQTANVCSVFFPT